MKKILPAPFGAIPGNFLHGPKKSKKMTPKLPIFLGGPMGPIHPVWGHVLVSFGSTWVCLTWVCDPLFNKNRGRRPTAGSLPWFCDDHVRQGVNLAGLARTLRLVWDFGVFYSSSWGLGGALK